MAHGRANPSVSFGNTNQHIVVMHVFRPSNTSSVWQVDVAQVSGNYAAPAAPRTVTIPGITTITDGALVFAAWASSDDNTWGSLTAGWSTPGSDQYRNTQAQFISNPCLQGHGDPPGLPGTSAKTRRLLEEMPVPV